MKPSSKYQEFKDKIHLSFKDESRIFLWCILVSFFLWFINTLNKPLTKNVLVAINYTNTGVRVTNNKTLPEYLEIQAKATGWDFLKFGYSDKQKQITVDISKSISQNFIASKNLVRDVRATIPNVYEIVSLYPDTIFLSIGNIANKKVPVVLNTKIATNFNNLYKKFTLNPSYIEITGNKDLIALINNIQTKPLIINNLKTKNSFTTELIIPKDIYVSSNNIVKIDIQTSKYIEITHSLLFKNKKIKREVMLIYQVPQRMLAETKNNLLKLSIDTLQNPLLNNSYHIYKLGFLETPKYINYPLVTSNQIIALKK